MIFYRDRHDNLYYMEFKPQTESLMNSSTREDGKTDDADYDGDTDNDDDREDDQELEDLQAAKKWWRVDINEAHQLLNHPGTTLL